MNRTAQRRILILVENLPVPLDRRVWLEATSLQAAGYTVSVICPMGRGWDAAYEEIEGVHIYRYPPPPEAHSGAFAFAREWATALWNMSRLSRKVRREQGFDVIQGCNPPDLLFLVALLWRFSGVRYLFDHHDVCPELYEAKFGKKGLLWRVMHLLERLNFASASVSMATNESFREIALTRGGMKPEDVFVVRSAPRVENFRPSDHTGSSDGITRMGYVGVIGQQEGMDLLVASADHLIHQLGHEKVHFEIVGFGPSLEDVKADVASRGLNEWFTFHGALYNEDLLAVLNSCDIGVSPDPKNDMNNICTMNKIMEYMTLEMPAVQFDLREGRASAGDAALYAEANSPEDFAARLAVLIEDPALREEMGKRGRKRVLEALSWEHSTANLLAAYDRIFEKNGWKAAPVGNPEVSAVQHGAE
ncbi:glycosyltransferase family 4 protein [Tropicimonas sp. TH_r6]|uniref:glycosyltransferase family 4 protein n=1 Tax=Tropicimonas sp. TH_r6 TaxID=3082085 RepID=UPI002952C555|nr:glycosyltransferase family 4 protein [Tropicimonas sp. TH_r6]MDV7145544.1 glycosyltransferase family 4 protein [Tropicimonas sp. TH_r6]